VEKYEWKFTWSKIILVVERSIYSVLTKNPMRSRRMVHWYLEVEPKLEKRKTNSGIWKGTRVVSINYIGIGVYIASSGYKALQNPSTTQNIHFFNELWNLKVLPPTLFFTWRVMLDRFPTKMNLDKIEITLGSLLYPLGQNQVETIAHTY